MSGIKKSMQPVKRLAYMGFFRSFLRIEVDELWKIRPNKKVTDIMQSHVMD